MAPRCDFSESIKAFYGPEFLDQIQLENRHPKTLNALVLVSSKDYNNSIKSFGSKFFLLNLARTHNVSLRTLEKISQIHDYIAEERKPIHLLDIEAHGFKDRLELGQEVYSVDVVEPLDFEGIAPDGIVFFNSCETALKLAPTVSKICNIIVYAPLNQLCAINNYFSYCEYHRCYEFLNYESDEQKVVRFEKDKAKVKCEISKDERDKYRSEFKAYLIKYASRDDIKDTERKDDERLDYEEWIYKYMAVGNSTEAQSSLGRIYQDENDNEKAVEYSLKAAKSGDSFSIYNLGYTLISLDNFKEAIKWLQPVAERGHPPAQNNLGFCYYKTDDLKKAEEWYLRAAKNKCHIAALNLCLIYEKLKDFNNFNYWKITSLYDLDSPSYCLGSILEDATKSNCIETIRCLLCFDNLPIIGKSSLSHALVIAAADGNKNLVELIIDDEKFKGIPEKGKDSIEEAYNAALEKGHKDIAEMLKKTGRV